MDLAKKALKILAILAILGAAGGYLLVEWVRLQAETTLRDFFRAVEQEPADRVRASIHPDLAARVDPQLLALFLKALVTRTGSYDSLKPGSGTYSDELGTQGRRQRYDGTMVFRLAELPLALEFAEGQLAAFSTTAPLALEVLASASVPPPDAAPYAAQGERFWTRLLGGDVEGAHGMLFGPLQEQVPAQQLRAQADTIRALGPLRAVRFLRPDPGQAPSARVFRYEIELGDRKVPAMVEIWFHDLRTDLVAYDLTVER